ncbi:MAG TPA: hypothetical protein VNA11_12250 [Pseudonocardia sp.]|nr:hypothetical protein [Pseudonocardia sp.]
MDELPLLGREDELAAVDRLIDGHRLVTVVGTGGVGKTRLAETLVRRRAQPAVCWLARHGAADQVAEAVAGALGYSSWAAAVLGLADHTGLLLLDNCEHLLDATADVVEQLLAEAPRLRVLATSREPLALPAERVFRLSPLPLSADPTDPLTAPAVRLFLDRAAATGTELRLDAATARDVVQLCRRLDGLPLAIELAAARTPALTPGEILAHLDRGLQALVGHRRAPARHRSLQAMIDWSYHRLDPPTQRFFDRLGAAEGLFTAEAALAVGGDPGEDLLDVVGHLEQLVARSLVQAHPRGGRTWYGMLDTLRTYARARLLAGGEFEAVTDRCIDWTVAQCRLVRERSCRAWSTDLALTTEALRHDILDALERVLEHDAHPDRAFVLYLPLWGADPEAGRAGGVAALGDRLLARWPDPGADGWAETAAVAATAHLAAGDRTRGRHLAESVWAGPEANPLATVLAGRALLLAALADGDRARALQLGEQAAALAQTHGLLPWQLEIASFRSIALVEGGTAAEAGEAVAALRSAQADAEAADSPILAAWCGLVHGHVLGAHDPDAARAVFERVIASSTGFPLGLGLAHRGLGALDLLTGRPAAAAGRLRSALDVLVSGAHAESGQPGGPGLSVAHVRGTLRWVAELAAAVGRADTADTLAAAAGPESPTDLGALLGRAGRPRPGRGSPVPAGRVTPGGGTARAAGDRTPGPSLRQAVVLARDLLDELVPVASTPATEPGAESAPAVAAFRWDGTVWSLTFAGRTVALPDAKGLHDLATLLAVPGREVDSVELAGAAVEQPDTGPLLDEQARRSYQLRIRELQAELADAEQAHDQRGADRARLELEALLDELGAATGLGGRRRSAASTRERARSTVGWRIRAALARIAEVHPELGEHLRAAVRTGARCSYRPDSAVFWER